MQISLTYKQSRGRDILHSVLLQVVSKLGDGGESVGSLDGFGVMGDDDGLAGLEGNDALFALVLQSVPNGRGRGWRGRKGYLLCLERIVACLDGHVLDAIDLDTLRDDLLGVRLVIEGFGNGCPFLIRQL